MRGSRHKQGGPRGRVYAGLSLWFGGGDKFKQIKNGLSGPPIGLEVPTARCACKVPAGPALLVLTSVVLVLVLYLLLLVSSVRPRREQGGGGEIWI